MINVSLITKDFKEFTLPHTQKQKTPRTKTFCPHPYICICIYIHTHIHLPYFVSIQTKFKRSNDWSVFISLVSSRNRIVTWEVHTSGPLLWIPGGLGSVTSEQIQAVSSDTVGVLGVTQLQVTRVRVSYIPPSTCIICMLCIFTCKGQWFPETANSQ